MPRRFRKLEQGDLPIIARWVPAHWDEDGFFLNDPERPKRSFDAGFSSWHGLRDWIDRHVAHSPRKALNHLLRQERTKRKRGEWKSVQLRKPVYDKIQEVISQTGARGASDAIDLLTKKAVALQIGDSLLNSAGTIRAFHRQLTQATARWLAMQQGVDPISDEREFGKLMDFEPMSIHNRYAHAKYAQDVGAYLVEHATDPLIWFHLVQLTGRPVEGSLDLRP